MTSMSIGSEHKVGFNEKAAPDCDEKEYAQTATLTSGMNNLGAPFTVV